VGLGHSQEEMKKARNRASNEGRKPRTGTRGKKESQGQIEYRRQKAMQEQRQEQRRGAGTQSGGNVESQEQSE
jgi:hypothetical protein